MLCFARIKSAFEMNNIQRGHVTLLHALCLGKITIRQAQVVNVAEREITDRRVNRSLNRDSVTLSDRLALTVL
jgi:hypothetical protein